jgi:hypothetical protein
MRKSLITARDELERGCYLYEEGKLEEAFLAFHQAAKLGNPEAQVNLANVYDDGEGVECDHKRAAYWYKRAIKKGIPITSPIAAHSLAISYKQQGKLKWASFWFKQADDMGYEDF